MSQNRHKPIADLLSRAIDQTLSQFEAGSSLTDAMVKTASNLRMNPDQITRACQLINRAKVNDTRLWSESLHNKLATVEVIDPQTVIRRCYALEDSGSAKTASATDVFPTATALLRAAPPVPATAKHASASPSRSPSAQARAETLAGLYHGLSGAEIVQEERRLIRKMAGIEDQLRLAASQLKYIHKLAGQQLSRLPADSQAELANQARFYFEEHAPDMLVTLHHVMDESMPVEAQLKLARIPEAPMSWHPALFDKLAFAKTIEQLDKSARQFKEDSSQAALEWGDAKARLEFLQSKTADGKVENRRIAIGRTALEEDLETIKVAAEKHAAGLGASFVGSLIGNRAGASKTVSPGVGPTDVDKFTLQIRHPQHEATLAAIRTRANLQDLINDDPVIASYDPNVVLSSFNDLAQYAPRATESRAVLRASLRQMLQNHASIFDLQQVRAAERAG